MDERSPHNKTENLAPGATIVLPKPASLGQPNLCPAGGNLLNQGISQNLLQDCSIVEHYTAKIR